MRLSAATTVCIAVTLIVSAAQPGSAHAAWNQPVGGDQPINRAANDPAANTSLASVDGVPWVAWVERHDNAEVRAARLNPAGTEWDRSPDTASPINESAGGDAELPSVAAHGGAPCVAWDEFDGVNTEIRVACRSGGQWDKVADSASPINESPSADASNPSLVSFGETLYVAWSELDADDVSQIRVARQNGNAWEKVPNAPSPINRVSTDSAHNPSLAVVGSELYVSWNENDGTSNKVRVSRLDGSTWELVADTPGGLNEDPGNNAAEPSLADVDGVPHVAWGEVDDNGHEQIRVARLSGDTAWLKVGQTLNPESPINWLFDKDADHPSVIGVGSPAVPHVAWTEVDDNGITEVRASRLNAAGTGWDKLADSTPINNSTEENAATASLAAVNGVPWVAWAEEDPNSTPTNPVAQARVSRLEPEFSGESATGVTQSGATLNTQVKTYGLAYEIGFEYGPSLGQSTTPQAAPTGQGDTVTFSQTVGGLSPDTSYQFRAFATAGTPAPVILGQIASFSTVSPAPVCTDISESGAHQAAVDLQLECSGVGPLAYEIVAGPTHGQISDLDTTAGTLTYTPDPGFAGQDTFTYRASNSGGTSNLATATIDVSPPPPSCTDVSNTTAHATPIQIALECTGAGALTYELVSEPTGGRITGLDAAAGTLTYRPNASFSGDDSFRYRATNAGGASDPARASIRVQSGSGPPNPPQPPSNRFSIGEPDKNKRKGTATVPVDVPGTGEVELAKTKSVKGATASAGRSGEVSLPVKPIGKARKKLRKKGRANVRIKVTFTPDGGEPNTQTDAVGLRKR